MQAALYARYSTDKQRQTSVEDQLRQAGQRAAMDGLSVVAEYSDREISAAQNVLSRPGSAAMMAAAAAGSFKVLILESLDRLSRDTVDQERVIRRLERLHGVRIICYSGDYDSQMANREMMRQIRGTVNEEQLRVIGHKVHRGLDGQISRGFHAGGLSYGFRSVVAGTDAHGNPIGHRLEVDPAQATWVRWIFERFAAGQSVQAITYELNRLGVRGPRGGQWARSAIYGAPAKGSGILNNALYIGRYVWNRSRWELDPDNPERRRRIDRPESEWVVDERPQLRIVSDEVWQAVRQRMDTPRLAGGTKGKGQQPRTLFGGLLTCGLCGGAMVAVDVRNYGCVARKEKGPTACQGVLVSRGKADDRLMAMAREDLLSPDAIAEYRRHVAQLLAEAERVRTGDAGSTRARLAELAAEIHNLVDAIAATGLSPALKKRLQEAESEQERLKALATVQTPSHTAVPAAVAAYKAQVLKLQRELKEDALRARKALQTLLGPIRILPAANGEVWAEFGEAQTEQRPRQLVATGGGSLGVVAGTRFNSQKRIRIT